MLNKIDLIADRDALRPIREALRALQPNWILDVSAASGEGLAQLRKTMLELLRKARDTQAALRQSDPLGDAL